MMWFTFKTVRGEVGNIKSDYDLEVRDLVTTDDRLAKKHSINLNVHVTSVSKKRLKLM